MSYISRNILSAFLMSMFTIVSITGILMYFKIRILSTEALHIWLGFTFVVIALLHLFKNWSGFVGYFKKSTTLASLGAGVFVIALFVIVPLLGPQDQKINPKGKMIGALMNSPIEKVATFLDMDGDLMIRQLNENYKIAAFSSQSVSEIAQANHKSNDEILQILFSR